MPPLDSQQQPSKKRKPTPTEQEEESLSTREEANEATVARAAVVDTPVAADAAAASASHLPRKKPAPSSTDSSSTKTATQKGQEGESSENTNNNKQQRAKATVQDEAESIAEKQSASKTAAAAAPDAKNKDASTRKRAPVISLSMRPATTTTGKTRICPSRLPSKKRKGSHDSSLHNGSNSSSSAAQQHLPPPAAATKTKSGSEPPQQQPQHHEARRDSATVATELSRKELSLGDSASTASVLRKLSLDHSSSNHTATPKSPSTMQQPPQTKPRTNSLSSLDEDLARRKWSQDSTLTDLSSPFRKHGEGAVELAPAPTAALALPRFDEMLQASNDSEDKTAPAAPSQEAAGASASPATEAAVASKSATSATGPSASSAATTRGGGRPRGKPKRGDEEEDDDGRASLSEATHASSEQKVLLEAIMLSTGGTMTDPATAAATTTATRTACSGSGGDRLGSLGGGSVQQRRERRESEESGIENHSSSRRERFGSLGSALDAAGFLGDSRRERLESWGAMSDLSGLHVGVSAFAAAAAAEAGSTDTATLPDLNAIPNGIAEGRERLNSAASLSEASQTGLPMQLEGVDVTIDLQAFVSATVESMGDQLAEIAGAVELAAGALDGDGEGLRLQEDDEDQQPANAEGDSEVSSSASPIIGATRDGLVSERARARKRARSLSVNSAALSVDQEALAVAVDAASAAAAALDLANIGKSLSSVSSSEHDENLKKKPARKGQGTDAGGRRRARRQLPMSSQRSRGGSDDPLSIEETAPRSRRSKRKTTSSITEIEEERLRERARAAAASVWGPATNTVKSESSKALKSKPLKKRAKRTSPDPLESNPSHGTPKQSNRTSAAHMDNLPSFEPLAPTSSPAVAEPVMSSSRAKRTGGGKGDQKWDSMLDHLIRYVEERREKETEGFPDAEKQAWLWDGNVPTNYKTDDGIPLGRWVNNQRTTKTKGSLREDRIRRLEEAGLKWSVVPPNGWNQSLEELRLYIEEQTKDGSEWDGNVPTNYQVKARPGESFGEDRNLGRWVNRQRGLYNTGKLRKDRQVALEKLGLRWSMQDVPTWEEMYDLLLKYSQEKTAETGEWDGNVPASYKTSGRNLGRWVNRQRYNYGKKKLKQEYMDKLNSIGFKWSVHGNKGSAANRAAADKENKKVAVAVVQAVATEAKSTGTKTEVKVGPPPKPDLENLPPLSPPSSPQRSKDNEESSSIQLTEV